MKYLTPKKFDPEDIISICNHEDILVEIMKEKEDDRVEKSLEKIDEVFVKEEIDEINEIKDTIKALEEKINSPKDDEEYKNLENEI